MINGTMCFLRDGRDILLIHRHGGEGDIHHGYYVPPGGKTKRGETGIECIVREFEEETGLILIDPKLRVIVTFYNEGRILGGQENPEDWCVELYEANNFVGELRQEDDKSEPVWVSDSDLAKIRTYPGDRKTIELLSQQGIYEVLVQYSREELISFEAERVDE